MRIYTYSLVSYDPSVSGRGKVYPDEPEYFTVFFKISIPIVERVITYDRLKQKKTHAS
jgi:hypothetical protein